MPVVHVSSASFQAELDDLARRLTDCFYEQWRTRVAAALRMLPREHLEETFRLLLNMGVIEIGPGLAPQEAMRERAENACPARA